MEGQRVTTTAPRTVRAWCLDILQQGSVAAKLVPPLDAAGQPLPDTDPGPAVVLAGPARDPGLQMAPGTEKLPKLGALRDKNARIAVLQRFAHHELMALELFAWALLAFPTMPAALRRGLVITLAEEQDHMRLYLARLAAHGGAFEGAHHSDYFWRQTGALAVSSAGPLAFLVAMGLTLEQANLDFTLMYRDGFRAAGDEETARVLQQVHDDEVGHVRLANVWLARLKGAAETDVDAYQRTVPFPLSAARAKGRRFDRPAREKAGLSPEMIDFVAAARPYE